MQQLTTTTGQVGEGIQKVLSHKIIKIASRGECVFVFGPPGAGKTMLFQNLCNYLSKDIVAVVFNCDLVSVSPIESLVKDVKELQDKLIEQPQLKLIVIIDHLDKIEGKQHTSTFLLLKSLRETARHRVGLVFVSDSNFKASQLENFGPIKPYLIENVLFIPPLSLEDSLIFGKQLDAHFESKLTSVKLQKIVQASGGLPRIIKRLIKLNCDGVEINKVIGNPSLDPKLQNDLELLSSFFKDNPDYVFPVPILANLRGSNKTSETILDVHFENQLTKQEHDLFAYLYKNVGVLVPREDLIKAVWPKNLYETSEHALDQMVHRLRLKLESASPEFKLLTHRGRGAKLISGN